MIYIGDRRNKISEDIIAESRVPLAVKLIITGKLRRYSGFKGWAKLKLWREYLLNFVDFFLIIFGCFQSFILLLTNRPQIVFSKGGMSALGVCLSALVLRIPIVTHDSDAIGSLTHRLIGHRAKLCLNGMPVRGGGVGKRQLYVGIPVDPLLRSPLDAKSIRSLRDKYDLPESSKVMLVVGGGQGARSINAGVLASINEIRPSEPVTLLIVTGKNNYSEAEDLLTNVSNNKITTRLTDFVTDMPSLLRMSSWVITRAGATALAEIAAAKKPAIIIPNPILPGSHQVHNANAYESAGAGLVVKDTGAQVNLTTLKQAMEDLFNNRELCSRLSSNIAKLAVYDASGRTLKALENLIEPRK